MTDGQTATETERYAAALKAVIEYAGEMGQQRRTMTPEEVLDLIGHEIQLEICFPQRWIVGVSAGPGPMPGPEFYAGRKEPIPDDEVFAVDPAGGGAAVGARRDSEGRIHTRIVEPPLPSNDLRPLMERVNETLRDMVAVQQHATFFQRGTAFERITRGDD